MQKEIDAKDLRFQSNSYGDRYLEAVVSPSLAAHEYNALWQTRYAPIDFERRHTYVFCGTDSGLLIKAFANSEAHRDLALLFVEDERILEAVRDECSAQLALMPNCRLMSSERFADSLSAAQLDTSLLGQRVNMLRAACAELDDEGWYAPLFAELHRRIQARQTIINSVGSRLPYIAQMLLNLPSMRVPATILKDRFRGMTVCVLAAGPSVDESIEWLRAHRSEVAIITVSRLCRRLTEIGITPDVVVSIDPQEISFDVSREGLQMRPAPILAFANQAVSRLVNQWEGPKVYVGPRLPWNMRDDEMPVRSLTVTNQAFDIAVAGSPSNIVLMGTDFCLDAAGHTHAKGNLEREQGISLRADMEEVVTYDGSIRLSSHDYYNSGKQLEKQIAAVHNQIRVINPSPNSMRLDNVIHAPLDELSSGFLAVPECIESLRADILDAAQASNYIEKTRHELGLFRKRSGELRALAEEGLSLLDQAEGDSPAALKANRKLHRIDKRINKEYRAERSFCLGFFSAHFAEILDTGADEGNSGHMDFDTTQARSRSIYKAYRDILNGMQEVNKHTRKVLKLWPEDNAEEWDDQFCQLMLTLGWPGILLQRPEKADSHWLAKALAQQEEQFQRRSARLRDVLDTMAVNEASLFKVMSTAYNQRSLDKLAHFKNALTQMNDFADRELYYRLSDAYQAEIIGDVELAMTSYQWIIDQGQTTLLEEALNRVAFLCIRTGDSHTALLALTVLSELNPMYEATLEQFRQVA